MVHLKVETRDIASIASMAALFVVLSFFPGIPVLGVEQARIGILSAVVPVFGFLLGPWRGGLAAFLGALAYRFLLNASGFSWLTLPATALSAFVAGSLGKRDVGGLRGWMVALVISGGLTLAWYGTPFGQSVWVYPALHWVGLALVRRGCRNNPLHASDFCCQNTHVS